MHPEAIKFFKKAGREGGLIAKKKGVDYRALQRKSVEKRLQNKKKLSTVTHLRPPRNKVH